jgi:hypothetical protein
MNLIAAADQPLAARVAYFTVVLVITIWLTAYTVVKSKRLSDWLDALSDERMSLRDKLRALWSVWKTRG